MDVMELIEAIKIAALNLWGTDRERVNIVDLKVTQKSVRDIVKEMLDESLTDISDSDS